MPLTIICVSCGVELNEPGGILLTAPNDQHQVAKHHMCPGCTEDALDFVLSTIESPGGHEPEHTPERCPSYGPYPDTDHCQLRNEHAGWHLRCIGGQYYTWTGIPSGMVTQYSWSQLIVVMPADQSFDFVAGERAAQPKHPQPLAHVLAEAGPTVQVTYDPAAPDYFLIEGVRVPLHKDPNR